MKSSIRFVLLLVGLLGGGCATSTIESRQAERASGYSNLTPEQKTAVSLGQIKVGMTMDAVYIAWGKPSQVLMSESSGATNVIWLYAGSYLQGYTSWNYPDPFGPYHGYYSGPFLSHDYVVMNYVSGEVVFEGGLVKSWRQLPRPGG